VRFLSKPLSARGLTSGGANGLEEALTAYSHERNTFNCFNVRVVSYFLIFWISLTQFSTARQFTRP